MIAKILCIFLVFAAALAAYIHSFSLASCILCVAIIVRQWSK
jgi:hypothetical protein